MNAKGIAGLLGLGVAGGSAGTIYGAKKYKEYRDEKNPPPPPPEKGLIDKGMDWAEENVYDPTWNAISSGSMKPGMRKLLTVLALLGVGAGGTYMLGKNRGRKGVLDQLRGQ